MGYRSEILIAVNDIHAKKLTELIEKTENKPDNILKNQEGFIKVAHYENTKLSYDVNDILDYFRNLEDSDQYGCIILGEDLNDNELLGNPYKFNMYLNRSIEFDWGGGKGYNVL